jgi:hypothetical protein
VANRSAALPLLKHDSCFVRSGIVTQAWALKVSDVPGATHNRIGSNRYRHRSAGAGVGSPGRDAGSGQTWRSRELVFLHRGPRVRIRLPPAVSQVRTAIGPPELPSAPRKQSRRRPPQGDRGFESTSLQQPVCLSGEPRGCKRKAPHFGGGLRVAGNVRTGVQAANRDYFALSL